MFNRSDLEFLVDTARPKLWLPMLLLVLSAYGLAGETIGAMELAVLSLFTLPANLVVYGLNDLYDWESDKHNGRKDGINPEKKEELLRKGILLSGIFGITVAILSGKPKVIAGCVLWLAGSYAYSVPPIRLKERPPLDALTNSLYVIAPGLMSFGLTGMKMPAELLWIAAAVPGGHAFSTIPDYEADEKADHTTFSVSFGKKAASLYALASGLVLLLLSPIESGVFRTYLVFSLLTGVYCYLHLNQQRVLERSAWLLYLTGNVVGIGYTLSVYGVI